jgi:hypothetical protein
MDYLFKSGLFFGIIFLESMLQLDLYQCQEEGNNILQPRVLYSSMIQLIDKVKAFNNKYSKSLVSVSEEIMVRSHLIAEYQN